MKKIVYTDGDRNKAISGTIKEEDEMFVTLETNSGAEFKIGKKVIVLIKEVVENGKNN